MLRAVCNRHCALMRAGNARRSGSGLAYLLLLLVLFTGVTQAAPALRTQVVQRGNFLLIGNTLAQDCAAGVPAPLVGTVGACGTNTADTAPDVFWRADSPAAGQAQANSSITAAQARSSAVLQLPAGAQVTQAYLYWAGNLASAADTAVTLERPGGFSAAVSAIQSFQALPNSYAAVADVTALVAEAGSGVYRVSGVDNLAFVNVNSGTVASGWWLVVLYRLDSEPVRQLSIHDGLDMVIDAAPAEVSVAGFQVPAAGYDGSVGVVALDGDSVAAGDQLLFNGTALSNVLNPVDNFFNGTRSHLGAAAGRVGDLPQLSGTPGSMSGLDLDVVDISAQLSPGQNSASVSAQVVTDTFWLASVVTAVATTSADFTSSPMSVTDLDGGAVEPGDELEYTVSVTNSGDEGAQSLRFVNVLPAMLAYVPGSLEVTGGANAGAKTDAQGDDQAEFVVADNTLVFRLGQGANALQGGQLAAGAQTTLRFRARIRTGDCGMHLGISNQGSIYADGAASGLPVSALTDGDPATAGAQATQVAVNVDCLIIALPSAPAHGQVSSSIAGFSCSAGQCTTSVPSGSSVTLTATADNGYGFGGWGDDCAAAGTALSATVTVNASTVCSATFVGLPNLILSVSDGRDYARYGELLNYVVTLSNSGTGDAGPITLTGALPPQLDAVQMSWACVGAGNGASCIAGGVGQLSDNTVVLPAGASLSWLVSAPVVADAQGGSVEYGVTADASSAGDSTALVLFREGFELEGAGRVAADGKVAPDSGIAAAADRGNVPRMVCADADAAMAASAVRLITLPSLSVAQAAVETVWQQRAEDGSGFRVERLNLERTGRVRLVSFTAQGEERSSNWAVLLPGNPLAVGMEESDEGVLVLLDGAQTSLVIALPGSARLSGQPACGGQ